MIFSNIMPAAVVALAALLAMPSADAAATPGSMVQLRRRAFKASAYPPGFKSPPRSSLPQDWVDALESLQSQGKIPDVPLSTATSQGVTYPGHGVGQNKTTCSWTVSKCYGPNDIRDLPDNHWLVSFDDGPTEVSGGLYDFLQQNNQPGTHFMIGSQILSFPDQLKHAMQTQQQPAVHTWSHTLQTTKTNYEVLGELGWTMQIIYDLAGVVPKYWRPPQGDVDARVRAIAEGVFNLTTVMWSDECNDWCLNENGSSGCPGEIPGTNYSTIVDAVHKALADNKSPGRILLEHELTKYSVGIFQDYYPSLKGMGWQPVSVPEAFGVDWYFNAANNSATPINVTSMLYSTVANETSALNQQSSSGTVKTGKNGNGSSAASTATSTNALQTPSSATKNAASAQNAMPWLMTLLSASCLAFALTLA